MVLEGRSVRLVVLAMDEGEEGCSEAAGVAGAPSVPWRLASSGFESALLLYSSTASWLGRWLLLGREETPAVLAVVSIVLFSVAVVVAVVAA